eukprot:gene16643-19774_t
MILKIENKNQKKTAGLGVWCCCARCWQALWRRSLSRLADKRAIATFPQLKITQCVDIGDAPSSESKQLDFMLTFGRSIFLL